MRPPAVLAGRLALLTAGFVLHAAADRPRRCLACRERLDSEGTAYDLTGGNRAAAAHHCRRCGSVMTVHVPTPGGAVTERLPAAEDVS